MLRSRIDEHKRLISPSMRYLPTEIISHIFDLSLPAFDSSWLNMGHHSVYPRLSDAPLLLCNICGRWRKIALSTPSLWCYLPLSVTFQNGSRMSTLLRTWFERSGAFPLWLSVCCDITCSDKDLLCIVNATFAFASRLKVLAFESCSFRNCPTPFPHSPPFPVLTTLLVKMTHPGSSDFPPIHASTLRVTPTFHTLIYPPVLLEDFSSMRTFSNLTKFALSFLRGHAYSADECLIVLSQCLQLTHFGASGMIQSTISSSEVIAPNLAVLYITVLGHYWDEDLMVDFFNRLRCPRLGFVMIESNTIAQYRTGKERGNLAFVELSRRSEHMLTPAFNRDGTQLAYCPNRYSEDEISQGRWWPDYAHLL
jgi:hypothetical protein